MVVYTCEAENCTFKTEDITSEALLLQMITNHRQDKHGNPGATAMISDRAARPEKPSITTNMTSYQWINTVKYWELYKKAARITYESDKITHLIMCCDTELKKQLFSIHNDILDKSEKDALQIIQNIAVKSESIIVAQVKLVNSRQSPDEPIRSYYARLKGQAVICDYNVKKLINGTEHSISYEEPMLKQIIASNMADPEIQVELLSHLNSITNTMTVNDMINFIEARENSKRSSIKLTTFHRSSAVNSTYRRNSRPPTSNHNNSNQQNTNTSHQGTKCSHCNKFGHGNHWGSQGAHIRKRLGCPAYGRTCNKCKRLGHFEVVCREKIQSHQSTSAVNNMEPEEVTIGGVINASHE